MAVVDVQFFSEALGKRVSYGMLLPDVGEGPFPVLFQLHGLSDDYHMWLLHSNIARHAAPYPFAIVFPDGGTHAYLDWPGDGRLARAQYERLIMQDIRNHLKRHFNVTDGPWAIGGLSMGGYGALHLGLSYPDQFRSIWAHSSKIYWDNLAEHQDVFGSEKANLHTTATRALEGGDPPTLTFDCGVDDGLIDENRAFHDELERIGFAHTYNEHPGTHDWDYWDDHVREALAQHARVLGVETS